MTPEQRLARALTDYILATDPTMGEALEIGAAFEEVRQALAGRFLKLVGPEGNPTYWRAVAFTWIGRQRPVKDYVEIEGRGPTPQAALQALAAKLA